jgi:glutathione reductase (NADPH)
LTPVASRDGDVVADNLLHGNRRKTDYSSVPSVAFSIPPIAAVGLGEAKAREQGLKFRMNARKASDWYTARQTAAPAYGYKRGVAEGDPVRVPDRRLGYRLHALGSPPVSACRGAALTK